MNSIHWNTKNERNLTEPGTSEARPLTRYQLPSVAAIAVVILYLVVWLFPVIASWVVAAFGFRFNLMAS
jgi:nitrate reductase NapE component